MSDTVIIDLKTGKPLQELPPSDADAALLDLCRQFDVDTRWLRGYDARSEATEPTPKEQDDLDLVSDSWHSGLYQIIDLPAKTDAGIRAKARALGHALTQCVAVESASSFKEQAEDYEQLAMSLVRDLAGEDAGADAELIRLCAEAMHQDGLAETGDFDAVDRALVRWFEVTAVIEKIPARTVEGMRAKAGIIRRLLAPMQARWAAGDTEDRTVHDPLVWSLVRDLAGETE